MNLEWRFPIAADFSGYLRSEIINVTNEQALISVTGLAAGNPPPQVPAYYQYPRFVRVMAGVTF